MLAIDDEVVPLLTQAVRVKFSFVAGAFLVIYDTVINFTDEVNFIWLKPWSFGKVLYIITRYCAFVDVFSIFWYFFRSTLTPESCRSGYEVMMWSSTFGIIVSELVLIIRTYTIWGRGTLVLIYLSITELAAITVAVFELDMSLKSTTFIPSPSPGVVACVPTLGDNRVFVTYCVVMGVDLNLLCLTLYKGLSQWRRNSEPLIHILYRDGVFYLVALFLISMADAIVVFKLFNSPYYYILFEPQRVLHGIIASRIVLNLRKAMDVTEVQTTVSKSFRDVFAESMIFASVSSSGGRSMECV